VEPNRKQAVIAIAARKLSTVPPRTAPLTSPQSLMLLVTQKESLIA
jgi:hypothetical protein